MIKAFLIVGYWVLLPLALITSLPLSAAPSDSNLARQYFAGDGVKQDYTKAAVLFAEAAKQGDAVGQNGMGVCLLHGFGVKKDQEAGVGYLLRAAKQGNAKACLNLAECLENGDGVEADRAEALKWAKVAQKNGSKEATTVVRRLSKPQAQLELPIRTTGTGFFITADGYLLTCAHVVKGAQAVRVARPGIDAAPLAARVVKIDADNDLALLKVDGQFSPVPLLDSDNVRMAQAVFTVGFPNVRQQGVAPKFTKGEISALSGAVDDQRLFQISVPVQPGNSGGPLVEEHGNVVGVVVARLNAEEMLRRTGGAPQNVNYAVKINRAMGVLASEPGLTLPATVKRKMELTEAAKRVEAATVMVLGMGG